MKRREFLNYLGISVAVVAVPAIAIEPPFVQTGGFMYSVESEGILKEAVVWDRPLSAKEIKRVEDYMMEKWGVNEFGAVR